MNSKSKLNFKWFSRGLVLLITLTALVIFTHGRASAISYGDVVISEILYDPFGAEPANEWVELYNPTSGSIDVSGWVLTDDVTWPYALEGQCVIPASTSISSEGFLVIAPSDIAGINEVVCTISGTFLLENSGDTLALYNGSAASAEMVFGSHNINYPGFGTPGDSRGLTNPMAGWSKYSADWAVESPTTPGSSNTGWDGVLTTYNDITSTFDGSVDTTTPEWDAGELLGTADNMSFYVTWDASNIYVGFVGGDSTANNDEYNVLIDIDPFDTGSNNSGTTSAYCGGTFGADAKPDYAIGLSRDGSGLNVDTQEASGGSWAAWSPTSGNTTGATNNNATGNAEFRIVKSDIGLNNSDHFGLYLYSCNSSSFVWAAWPPENEVNASSSVELTTRVVFDATGETRSPRGDAAHLGIETRSIGTGDTNVYFFDDADDTDDWYAWLIFEDRVDAACDVTVQVYANHLVSRLNGGARRLYTITPSGCSGYSVRITLKTENGCCYTSPSETANISSENSIQLFSWNSSTSNWDLYTNSAAATNKLRAYITSGNGTTDLSGVWSIGSSANAPTAITLQRINARAENPNLPTALTFFAIIALLTTGIILLYTQKRGR